MSQPILAWEGCLNARDVGGLPVTDGGHIRRNSLLRSDSLGYLSPSGVETVRRHGVSAIIDLRSPGEGSSAEASAVPHPFAEDSTYHSIPMFVPRAENLDPELLANATTAELYCAIVDRYGQRIGAAVAAIALAPPGPVVVHCADGKDRTGIVVAVVLSTLGVSNADIAEDYAESERRLATRLARLLAAESDMGIRALIQRHWPTAADTMVRLLEHVDQEYGGAAAYLRTHGVDDNALCILRDRLCPPG